MLSPSFFGPPLPDFRPFPIFNVHLLIDKSDIRQLTNYQISQMVFNA